MLHRSPGLTAIYNEIKSSNRNRILDLGSLVAGNFNFLASLSCKVHFENLDELIEEYGKLSVNNLVYRLEKFLLNHNDGVKFEVILAWDLLNYLPLEAIETLFARLNPWCHPNTLLHSISYLGAKIPGLPARFEIIDQYHINIRAKELQPRRISAHQTAALLKRIPDYYLHNHLMNESGMLKGITEHVLRFQPDKASRKQFISSTEIVRTDPQNSPADGGHQKSSEFSATEHYRSPALKTLLASISKKHRLLDLGSKSSHNMDFWRSHFHEVYAEDLASSVRWQSSYWQNRPVKGLGLSEQALKFETSMSFDAIVFWDSLNFCDREQLQAIGERLSQHCKPGTLLVMYSYLGQEIPEYPLKFQMVSDGSYRVSRNRKIPRTTAALTTAAIMKLVPKWKIQSTHIFTQGMKPGVVELVFEQI